MLECKDWKALHLQQLENNSVAQLAGADHIATHKMKSCNHFSPLWLFCFENKVLECMCATMAVTLIVEDNFTVICTVMQYSSAIFRYDPYYIQVVIDFMDAHLTHLVFYFRLNLRNTEYVGSKLKYNCNVIPFISNLKKRRKTTKNSQNKWNK